MYEENILVPAFMQIDSPTMSAGKIRTVSYVVSNDLSYYSSFFYIVLLFLLLMSYSTFFFNFFLFASHRATLESVFVPLNTVEKSIETHSTIFHSEKGILGSVKKNEKLQNAPFIQAFIQQIWMCL